MKKDNLGYRPHVDGLRAIAIVSVILYHLNSGLFPGGYLGVDIFFVISGFVISQSLYKNYVNYGKINILNFYLKRFKRLYPALFVMVFVTTIAYLFFGLLWDTNLLLKSAFSAIFASSNLYFLFHGSSYFQPSVINPLVHTWSLGVEEQFYFIYPLSLVFLFYLCKRLRLHIIYVGLILLTVSVFSYILFKSMSNFFYGDFYFPLARFWEIGAGCSLFFFSQFFSFRFLASFATVMAGVTLFLVQFFESSIQNIQVETFVTVLATVVIIYGGINGHNLFTKLLAYPITTYLGRISYSLYLWHLPIIYFSFLYLSTFYYYLVVPVFSILFAVLSYHYIEQPLRYSKLLNQPLKIGIKLLSATALFMLIFFAVFGTRSFKLSINNIFNYVNTNVSNINYIESNYGLGERMQPTYSFGQGLNGTDCHFDKKAKSINSLGLRDECFKKDNNDDTLFYLTGDSHALHYVPMFDKSTLITNFYFIEIPRQSIAHEKHELFDPVLSQRVLEGQENELKKLSKKYNKIYYFTSLFLSPWDEQIDTEKLRLENYINVLGKYANLVFIAPTPVFPTGPESCVLLGKYCTINKNMDLERRKKTLDMYKTFAKKYKNVFIYDPYNAICPNDKCRIYYPESDFLAFIDNDHISYEQSIRLAPNFDQWLQKILK